MQLKKFVFLFTAPLFLSSCITAYYYHPALYNNDVAYVPKPLSTDQSKTSQYVSAGLVTGDAEGGDSYTYATLNLNQAHTFNHVNIGYGVYGFAGSYHNSQLPDSARTYFNSKGFYGYGGRFSINYYQHVGRADIRFLGAEVHYSRELGDYAEFRNSVNRMDNYWVDAAKELVTVGGTSEVAWHGAYDKDIQYAVRGFIGTTIGNHDLESLKYGTTHNYENSTNSSTGNIIFSGSFYFQYHNLFAVVENGGIHTSLKLGFRF